ncbi:MAG: DUF4129 domain-containing transglutaminase family protein [Anaerolineae bacterium]
MRALLRWLWEHSPPPGWSALLLLVGALLCPALSFATGGWHRDGWLVVPAVLSGCAVGYLLGALPLRAALGWVALGLAGGEVTVVLAARALPHPSSVLWEGRRALAWAWALARGQWPSGPLPGLVFLWDGWARVAALLRELAQWAGDVAGGRTVLTLTPFLVLSLYLAWLVGAAGGWGLRRGGHPLAALALAGVALVLHALYAPMEQIPWLLSFLAAASLLALRAHWWHLLQGWRTRGVDYPDQLGLEFHAFGLVIAGAVVLGAALLAPTLDKVSPRQVADFFWRRFGEPFLQADREVRRALPPLDQAGGGIPVAAGGAGSLPREHLLGGNPALAQEFAFEVALVPPEASPPPLLWRQVTYDLYTGRGWAQSAVEGREHPGGALDLPLERGARREVVQVFRWGGAGERALAFLSEPAWLEPAARLYLGPGDTLWAAVAEARSYRAVSWVPNVGEEALRQAHGEYPPWVQPFLQLPPMPAEVERLVREVTSGLETPYDRARALEGFLRGMEYSLDVLPPPPGRDVVAYLVLDLKRGYCDYFATAMAVMARMAGIPSRLVAGYAGGVYRDDCACFWVSEAHAHSWAELYFPGVGWVPFEATPAFPLPAREAVEVAESPVSLPSAPLPLRPGAFGLEASHVAFWVGGASLLLLVGGGMAWGVQEVRLRRSPPREQAQVLYRRWVRWGERLGVLWAPHLTPEEYAQRLAAWARRTLPAAWQGTAEEIRREGEAWVRTYLALTYGPPRPEEVQGEEARRLRWLWGRLQRLFLAWWVRRWLR